MNVGLLATSDQSLTHRVAWSETKLRRLVSRGYVTNCVTSSRYRKQGASRGKNSFLRRPARGFTANDGTRGTPARMRLGFRGGLTLQMSARFWFAMQRK